MAATKPKNDSTANAIFIASANALAGAIGGVAAMALIYPLDVVRCRLQAQAADIEKLKAIAEEEEKKYSQDDHKEPENDHSHTHNGVLASQEEEDDDEREEEEEDKEEREEKRKKRQLKKHKYENTISQVIKDIIKEEGLGGFYKAMSSQLIGIFISDIVYFFTVTLLKKLWYGKREVTPTQDLITATIAGIINVLMTTPYWTAQTQMMLQSKRSQNNNNDMVYNNILDAMYKIFSKEGFDGLYKGLGPTLLLVSNPIIQFVCYEQLINIIKFKQQQNLHANVNKKIQLTSTQYFIIGAIAKTIATYATYPLQVMKTILQKQNSELKSTNDGFEWLFKQIRTGNIAPLYAGLYAKLFQTVSNTAIKFMVYEKILNLVKFALLTIIFTFIKKKVQKSA